MYPDRRTNMGGTTNVNQPTVSHFNRHSGVSEGFYKQLVSTTRSMTRSVAPRIVTYIL